MCACIPPMCMHKVLMCAMCAIAVPLQTAALQCTLYTRPLGSGSCCVNTCQFNLRIAILYCRAIATRLILVQVEFRLDALLVTLTLHRSSC